MFGANWTISVSIITSSNFGKIASQMSQQSAAAQKSVSGLKSSISGIAGSSAVANKSLGQLVSSMTNLGTALSGVLVAGGASFMGGALSDAAKLQQTLLSIKNETGASGFQIGSFYQTAFDIANRNAMTPEQGGEMLRTISRLTAGQFDVSKMMKIAPTVAQYASAVHFNRPEIGIEDAARTGIQTAHLFQAYQPAQLSKLLDSAYRLSGLMAEAPDAALRQLAYYTPLFKALKIGDETSIGMMALLDRAGFRNKVGTNVRALALESLGPLQLTTSAQKGKLGILTDMGLFKNGKFAWNTPDGGMDYFGELGAIANWAKAQSAARQPMSKIAQEMVSALGKQGATVGSLFLNAEMPGILDGIRKYLQDPNVGLKSAAANRDSGLGFQFTRATSNLTAVMTELGYPWLQDVTRFFKGLADNLHGFQAWLHGHRDAEKQIGEVVAGMTALAGIRFSVGAASVLVSGAKALGLLGAAAPGVSLAAKGFAVLDGIFLAGFGGRVLGSATSMAVLNGAMSAFSVVMGGSAVAGVPVALMSLRASIMALTATGVTSAISSFATIMGGAAVAGVPSALLSLRTAIMALTGTGVISSINSFAAIMGGSAVAGIPAALSAVGIGLAGLAVPLAALAATIAVFRPSAAGSDEGTIRNGGSAKTYGTQPFWENFAKLHGWKSVPTDVVRSLRSLHTEQAQHSKLLDKNGTSKLAVSTAGSQSGLTLRSMQSVTHHIHRTREVHHHDHRPVTLAPVIHVNGGKNPQETGRTVGMVIEHHLRTAGLLRNDYGHGNYAKPSVA